MFSLTSFLPSTVYCVFVCIMYHFALTKPLHWPKKNTCSTVKSNVLLAPRRQLL